MKLIYRSTNKVVERRERIRVLEAIDKECTEKLLDIEHKFKDVRNEDIAWFVTRIVGEDEKATLKALYELLKEYKQGFLGDVDVVEEIELYEESLTEAKASTSTPTTNVEPPTAGVPTMN
ncbi:hypothetical protein TIFTF001_028400 [Ficus carica]|uniref:Uncharacterized protein n=1 Tax=Ficus carica TaxID=3494 RepID=A0AA88J035_FICCA|nr:hypothetical protein TIFTF001_028400 [Ficus carica]